VCGRTPRTVRWGAGGNQESVGLRRATPGASRLPDHSRSERSVQVDEVLNTDFDCAARLENSACRPRAVAVAGDVARHTGAAACFRDPRSGRADAGRCSLSGARFRRTILRRLEERARELGYCTVRLDTTLG
jgi:hypothetical protein